MPRTRIAVGFRTVSYIWALVVRQRVLETDFAIPTFEFEDIIFVIRVFDIELLVPANWAFGVGHRYSPSFETIRRHLAAIFGTAVKIELFQRYFNIGFPQCSIELMGAEKFIEKEHFARPHRTVLDPIQSGTYSDLMGNHPSRGDI